MVFVCYLLLKEADIHINFIWCHHNFDDPHIYVVIFVPRKQSKKPQFLFKRSLICYCSWVCPHVSQIVKIAMLFSVLLLAKCCCTFEKLTENIVSDCFGARFVPPF